MDEGSTASSSLMAQMMAHCKAAIKIRDTIALNESPAVANEFLLNSLNLHFPHGHFEFVPDQKPVAIGDKLLAEAPAPTPVSGSSMQPDQCTDNLLASGQTEETIPETPDLVDQPKQNGQEIDRVVQGSDVEVPRLQASHIIRLTDNLSLKLRRHLKLNEITRILPDIPKDMEPSQCDLPVCTRFLDDLDNFQLDLVDLQLHPEVVSILTRLSKLTKWHNKDKAICKLIDRVLKVVQKQMATCNCTEGGPFRALVLHHQSVLQRVPPTLYYLAETESQLNHLHNLPRSHPCYEQCNLLSSVEEFCNATNIRQLVKAEIEEGGGLVDEAIAEIFRTYVPMRPAWHCTLLQDVRLNERSELKACGENEAAMLKLTVGRAAKLRRHIKLYAIEKKLLALVKPRTKKALGANVMACMSILDDLDRFDLTTQCHQLHPAITSQLNKQLRTQSNDKTVCEMQLRIQNTLVALLSACGFTFQTGAQFFALVGQLKNVLATTPRELTYLAERESHIVRLIEVHNVPLPDAVRTCFDRCNAMASPIDFDHGTNVRALIAEESGTSEANTSPAESIDETIALIFKTYVPMEIAWHLTMLSRICVAAEPSPDQSSMASIPPAQPEMLAPDAAETPSLPELVVKMEPGTLQSGPDASWRHDVQVIELNSNQPVDLTTDTEDDVEQLFARCSAMPAAAETFDASQYIRECAVAQSSSGGSSSQAIQAPQTSDETDGGAQTPMTPLTTPPSMSPVPAEPASSARSVSPSVMLTASSVPLESDVIQPKVSKPNRAIRSTKSNNPDRTVILRHDFQPLVLLQRIHHAGTASGSTPKRRKMPVNKVRPQTRAASQSQNEFEIEDASMRVDENLDDECSMLARMPLGTDSQIAAAAQKTPIANTNIESDEDNQPQVISPQGITHDNCYSRTLSNSARLPRRPADPAAKSATIPTAQEQSAQHPDHIRPQQQQYLKMTFISEAAFDLSGDEQNDPPGDDDDDNKTNPPQSRIVRQFSMRVRFGQQGHWMHLDETASRALLQLTNEAQWRTVRPILFRQRRFKYHPFDDKFRDRSLCERIVWLLFDTLSLARAGLTTMTSGSGGRTEVLRMAELVRNQLRAEQLERRSQRVGVPSKRLPVPLEAFVLDGLRRQRRMRMDLGG